MSKDAVGDWSTTAGDNTDIGGIPLGEGVTLPSHVNNAIRTMMAQIAAAGFVTSAYTAGGTDVALADGGTGASLTDPDADRILFWDDSAGAVTWLAASTGLSISGTNLAIDTSVVARLGTEDQTLSGGARVTVKDLGNLSGQSITPDPGDRPIQKITNNGAGSILPGSNEGSYILQVINTTGAGATTTTGWTLKGDSFDTTTTSKFLCSCLVTSDIKTMTITKVA